MDSTDRWQPIAPASDDPGTQHRPAISTRKRRQAVAVACTQCRSGKAKACSAARFETPLYSIDLFAVRWYKADVYKVQRQRSDLSIRCSRRRVKGGTNEVAKARQSVQQSRRDGACHSLSTLRKRYRGFDYSRQAQTRPAHGGHCQKFSNGIAHGVCGSPTKVRGGHPSLPSSPSWPSPSSQYMRAQS